MEKLKVNNEIIEYEFLKKDNVYKVKIKDSTLKALLFKKGEYFLLNDFESNQFKFADIYHGKDYAIVWIDDEEYLIKNEEEAAGSQDEIKETTIVAPMPGIIKEIKFKEGDEINKGDNAIVLESMKVLNELKSSINGVVKKIHVSVGLQVGALELLVEIEPKMGEANE